MLTLDAKTLAITITDALNECETMWEEEFLTSLRFRFDRKRGVIIATEYIATEDGEEEPGRRFIIHLAEAKNG